MTAPTAAVAGSLPLTQAMLGLMVVARMTGPTAQYDVTAELELDPTLPPGAVRSAIAGLLAVQPALRLGLHERPAPHGRLLPPPDVSDVPLSVIAAASGFEETLAGARELVGAGAFDLSRPPLARFVHLAGADRSVLLLCVHHAVFDGLSIVCLVQDLNALLTGDLDVASLRQRREHALRSELDAQVGAAGTEATAAAARNWARRLRATTDLDLHPRPGRPTDTDLHGTRHEIRLDAATSSAVDDTCRALGISPFTFFSAVFGAVVARHTGAPGAVLGTPVLARRTVGSFALCGMFTTTLPLVLEIDWSMPFSRYATTVVAGETAAVKRDAAVPWSAVVGELGPSRHSSRNPGFSSMIAMQDATDVPPGGAVRAVRELGNGTAKMDLWLGVTPTAGRWLLEVETDTLLLPGPVTRGVLDSVTSAVTQAAHLPHLTLAELFTDAATPGALTPAPAGTLRARLYRAVTDRTLPGDGGGAVEDGPRRLDRAALDALVTAATTGLAARGVGRGDVVGLTTDGLADTVVAILAVLRTGAAYLPLDAGLPAARLTHMVGTAGCRLAIGPGSVPGVGSVTLDELTAAGPDADAGRGPATDAGRDDPVYVMFTSGSTGLPKGVLMGDRPLHNLTEWQIGALGLGPGTRFLQYAPLGFDVSFQEIVPVLVAGGTVVSREPADRRDLPAVVRRVRDAEVTHVYLPVAALRFFTQAAADAGLALPRLRHVCVSGEQLVLDAGIREFFTARPHLTLTNLYGPTETHAVTTQSFTAGGDWPVHAPIGRPIAGVSAQVVDRTGHLAPVGVAGELLLGGRCPAQGYVGDPEQTAARFVPDPHGGPLAVRYRTGDQVLWDTDGALVFLGRRDEQIKISGHRVELGDVEAAALALPGVRHAVAAARGDGADRQLLLFVVPGPGYDQTGTVRVALSGVLPAYMVPAEVLAIDSVPRTGNGKVDRAALVALAGELRAADAVPAGPAKTQTDPVLDRLERLWGEHLGRARVDPDTSLFDQGAHSLMVLSVIATLEQEHGVRIPMLAFFHRPTLRALAGTLEETR